MDSSYPCANNSFLQFQKFSDFLAVTTMTEEAHDAFIHIVNAGGLEEDLPQPQQESFDGIGTVAGCLSTFIVVGMSAIAFLVVKLLV